MTEFTKTERKVLRELVARVYEADAHAVLEEWSESSRGGAMENLRAPTFWQPFTSSIKGSHGSCGQDIRP